MDFTSTDPNSPHEDSSSDNDFYSDPAKFFAAIGRPVPRLVSADQLRDEARGRAIEIFHHYDFLQKILQRHELTIRKGWTKKTRQQRIRVLLKAWPDMPASHRPDFEAFRKKGPQSRPGSKKDAACFMWPYINQEDLAQTQPLLLFLNARGRELPSSFAAADREAMHLGIVSEAIERPFLNEYTMILHGVTSVEDYGKLLSWDDHPDAFDWMNTQKQFYPADGIVVLEAQDRLMRFLVDCCRDILHDIHEDQLISDSYPNQAEPPFKTERELHGFESLASMAAEAPYRVPARLDLRQLESLLAAKTRAAEDHLWALREDPAYFHQHLLESREHRQEMITDTEGRPHPTLTRAREGLFWARVIGNVLVDAYPELETFSMLHEQATTLVTLQEKYKSTISPMKDLPEEYLTALLRFRDFLSRAVKGPLAQLKQVVAASPPMRRLYARIPPLDATSSKIGVVWKGPKTTKVEDQLTYLLKTLWEDGRNLFLLRLSIVVDELQRLVQSEPTARELISSRVASVIGNLSIISQCLHQLELYQPWAQNFESAAVDIQDDLDNSFSEKSKLWAQVMAAFKDSRLGGVAKLGEPLPGRFTYPLDKGRTRENVEKLRRAEWNLDAFWAEVDRIAHSEIGSMKGSAVQRLLSRACILYRTPEWVEQSPTTKMITTPAIEQPLSPFHFGSWNNNQPQGPTTSRLSANPAKAKVKTRGATAEQAKDDKGRHKEEGDTARPSLMVDNRALKVFRVLFFNPDVTSTPGEVSWNDFIHAMTSVGFAAQKLYGSAWQFSPSNSDLRGSTHFHEPHPTNKIPFTMARRYGRRLTRAYGWVGNMFTLRK